ncbi:hypothetical protein FG386_002089 [Cryptosporidium ryanae]|uniref:uncharacterized protein n=1 Tax=Cryptosporidium ryanae TaxID=515981 RepID=UPI00351A289A|nr:hypothetical protein FG386_002089 [Cryptosporidium ryanae]
MDPRFRVNLRPVLDNCNSLNTPKIFVRSTSVGNNGHHLTKTPITTYRSTSNHQIGPQLINTYNGRFYSAFSPMKMHNNFVLCTENSSALRSENENYPQISTDSRININESDTIPTYRSEIYPSSANRDFVFEENLIKPVFTHLTSLPESNLPSTSASENEINTLNLGSLKSTSTGIQEHRMLTQKKESLHRLDKRESEGGVTFENGFQDELLLQTETHTSMEILITPPESSDLKRSDDFYISEETDSRSETQEATLLRLLNKAQEGENPPVTNEQETNNTKASISTKTSRGSVRFSHFCAAIINCIFPWVNYGQYQDEKPKVYYEVLNEELEHLIQKK